MDLHNRWFVTMEMPIGVAALDDDGNTDELSKNGRVDGRAEHSKTNHLDVIVVH